MTRAMPPTIATAFRRVAVPLACYYGVTLVMPIANGAAQSGAVFLGHALVVLVVPPILVLMGCAICKMAHVLGR